MNLTITSAQNYGTKKDGSPILDNKGVQKYRSVIKTVERGEEMLSGFVYKELKAGDVIDATVKPDTYNGVTRMTFSINSAPAGVARAGQDTSAVTAELKNHTIFLKQILTAVEGIAMSISTHQTIESIKKPSVAPSVAPVLAPVDSLDDTIGELSTEALEVSDEDDFGDPLGGEDPFNQ